MTFIGDFLLGNWDKIVFLCLIPIIVKLMGIKDTIRKHDRLILGEEGNPGILDKLNQAIDKIDKLIAKMDGDLDKHGESIKEIFTRLLIAEKEIDGLRPVKHEMNNIRQILIGYDNEFKWIRDALMGLKKDAK